MRHYDHLLDKFSVSNETRELASDLLRQAKLKTAQGSGRELGELNTGLPAVCTLLASERLNTNEMSQQSAQVASCLKKKDFKRAYDIVRAVIEEFEKEWEDRSAYAKLHEKYDTGGAVQKKLEPYFTETENELMILTMGHVYTTQMLRCAVYFWVCGSAKLKNIPPADVFACEHRIHLRKFIDILKLLSMKKLDLRRKIWAIFRESKPSPEQSDSVASTTCRQSRRRAAPSTAVASALESRSKAGLKPSRPREEQQSEPYTLQQSLALQQESLSKATPTRRTPRAPAVSLKVAQPSSRKRTMEALQEEGSHRKEVASPEEPPAKRTKVAVEESPSKMTTRSASASTAAVASQKAKAPAEAIEIVDATESAVLKSPRKRKCGQGLSILPAQSSSKTTVRMREGGSLEEVMAPVDSASLHDVNEPEMPETSAQFHPVYFESWRWNVRDPRPAKIWRKAEKNLAASLQAV